MKKVIATFLIGVVVIAGVLLIKRHNENIVTDEQPGLNQTTKMEIPPVQGDAPNMTADITAENAYLLDVESNSVLYHKNSDEHIAPASTTKMLTALTVLEYCSLDEKFTVGKEINLIASDSSVAGLKQGEKLTVKQLLVALLLPSGNDAAYTLAVNAGKKIADNNGLTAQKAVKAFVDAMNQKAREIGAASSHFATPDGYDANGQYTTAADLAQIAKACLKNKALSEIVSRYRISDTLSSGREVTYLNTNELINPAGLYYYSNVVGLKTGHSGAAGYCLVSAATIKGKTYICVIMGGSENGRFSDSLKIYTQLDPGFTMPTRPERSGAPGGRRGFGD